jgi:hypothetical protein
VRGLTDKLFGRRVPYTYEAAVVLDGGSQRYPDFTIDDSNSDRTFYWEHLGLLEDAGYRRRWDAKLDLYRRSGILPHEEGGGPNGTLITTRDSPVGGIDAAEIGRIIDEVIRGA